MTLLPAAFDGGTSTAAGRCLAPGEAASARVYVHEPSVTFTVRGAGTAGSSLAVGLGPESPLKQEIGGDTAEITHEAHPPSGVQELRVSLTAGSFCLTEVALRQP